MPVANSSAFTPLLRMSLVPRINYLLGYLLMAMLASLCTLQLLLDRKEIRNRASSPLQVCPLVPILTTSCVRVLFNCIWKLCANQFCANPVDALRASEFKIAVYCKLDYEVANLAPS